MDEALKEIILRWLAFATEDLIVAKRLAEEYPPVPRTACYHAQQCAEKSLKAYLISVGQHVLKIHDLTLLITHCERYDASFGRLAQIAQSLTEYAVKTRYPTDWRVIPYEEAQEAVARAQEVMAFVMGKLGMGDG